MGPDTYLEHVRRVKAAVEIPVIASLNGVSSGGWVEYACAMQQAGADALELNVYFVPTNPFTTGSWMEEHEYASIAEMRGSMSQQHVAEPAAFERANYLKVLRSYALRSHPGVK